MTDQKTRTQQEWFIGLMSGTSLDGMDMAAVCFEGNTVSHTVTDFAPYPTALREQLSTFATSDQYDPVAFGQVDNTLGQFYATTLLETLKKPSIASQIQLSHIKAIGNHGQTIRHHPIGPIPFTWQMGNPHYLCLATQKPVCYDFRRMDVAAGGQGAPLAPLFHEYLYQSPTTTTVVINLGGIANITVLGEEKHGKQTLACDTGPANTLLDHWAQRHINKPYDEDGSWGRSGVLNQRLLDKLLQHPYFKQPSPKSTGPETFHITWLEQLIEECSDPISHVDVQCTLHEFSAQTLYAHIKQALSQIKTSHIEVEIAGGGVRNSYLMQLITDKLAAIDTVTFKTEPLIHPDFMEAAAFAWLARERYYNRPLDTAPYTGATRPVILGSMIQP